MSIRELSTCGARKVGEWKSNGSNAGECLKNITGRINFVLGRMNYTYKSLPTPRPGRRALAHLLHCVTATILLNTTMWKRGHKAQRDAGRRQGRGEEGGKKGCGHKDTRTADASHGHCILNTFDGQSDGHTHTHTHTHVHFTPLTQKHTTKSCTI